MFRYHHHGATSNHFTNWRDMCVCVEFLFLFLFYSFIFLANTTVHFSQIQDDFKKKSTKFQKQIFFMSFWLFLWFKMFLYFTHDVCIYVCSRRWFICLSSIFIATVYCLFTFSPIWTQCSWPNFSRFILFLKIYYLLNKKKYWKLFVELKIITACLWSVEF